VNMRKNELTKLLIGILIGLVLMHLYRTQTAQGRASGA